MNDWIKPDELTITRKLSLAWRVFAAKHTLPWEYTSYFYHGMYPSTGLGWHASTSESERVKTRKMLNDFADFVAIERLKGNL